MTADSLGEGAGDGKKGPLDELGARLQAALGDDYAVEGQLGAGGFAVVYLVRDVHLKRKLAVKVLSPDIIASHSVLERFRREAETIAQLSHPHIVPLHFIGQKNDLVYLVMEAIDGGSLGDRLEREGQLTIEEAARIFGEVASALAHAHKRGVIHRDIKPQNVLLDSESGRALVTDFGIARTAEGGSLTATGMVVGTPAYLSPEQVTGEPSDHRADIYALGVMMYQMLTGQPPFTGATPTAVLMKRLAGAPAPIQSLRPDVPDSLVELVDACLATDPNDRLNNAGDIVRHLTGHSPVSGGHTTSARIRVQKSQPKSRSKALTIGVIAAVIIGAVAVALVGSLRRSQGPAPGTSAMPVDSEMVLVPAGTYTIGSNSGPDVARPAHPVALGAFGIDAHEVTVGDYEAFVQQGACAGTLGRPGAPRWKPAGHGRVVRGGSELLRLETSRRRPAANRSRVGSGGAPDVRSHIPVGRYLESGRGEHRLASQESDDRGELSRGAHAGGRGRHDRQRVGVDVVAVQVVRGHDAQRQRSVCHSRRQLELARSGVYDRLSRPSAECRRARRPRVDRIPLRDAGAKVTVRATTPTTLFARARRTAAVRESPSPRRR